MSDEREQLNRRIEELLRRYADPGTGVATLLCDQHPANAIAYVVVDETGAQRAITFGQLRASSERFASSLAELGIRRGDRVATLMSRGAEHLVAVVAIWRLGAVHVPLFTAFAPPAVLMRLERSETKAVICDSEQRSKLKSEDPSQQTAWKVIVTGTPEDSDDLDFADLVSNGHPGTAATPLSGHEPIVQIFTSGTTGGPKGVVVPKTAIAGFHAYMEFGLGLRRDDVFWNAADPGWAYGLYLGVIGSLSLGVRSVLLRGAFSPERTWAVMAQLGVTNFTAAPTVYRSLRSAGLRTPDGLRLRCASSAGEPLTPEINAWAREALGLEVHDHYGQTETGMLVNNHHHPALKRPVKPGAMGQAMPGWRIGVLRHDVDVEAPAGEVGRIAYEVGASPLAWFSGYVDAPDKSAERFTADRRWFLTGDSGSVDDEGDVHFLSRDDDVIIMAGYRIGPFDVESVLLTHPCVAEAAVIGAPDDVRGEVLEAYVVLADTAKGDAAMVSELQSLVRSQFAKHAYPRVVHFVDELPKTPSGKVQRFILRDRRARELTNARSL